ncbi:uncharacterized protein [Clytia hemisphaerica]|uniref:uncharacterized protein isoform X1 n=1 Tax=Clytia hemisphaerica TaxID=252671 RepID=UPI0034D43E6F
MPRAAKRPLVLNATSTPNGVKVLLPRGQNQETSPNMRNNNIDDTLPILDDSTSRDDSQITQRKAKTAKRSINRRKHYRQDMKRKIKQRKGKAKEQMKHNLINAKKELKKLKNELITQSSKRKPINRRVVQKLAFTMPAKTKYSQMKKNCRNELLSSLSSTIPAFTKDKISLYSNGYPKWSGVFGEVVLCKINFLGITCAKKNIKGTMADLRAEALVLQHLSGSSFVPYLFGILDSGSILMEFVSGSKTSITTAQTLRSVLGKSKIKKSQWFKVCRELVEGLTYIHEKNILHNDLHGENILLRPSLSPCIIDFGKATLINAPMMYDIAPGSKEQDIYNKRHQHLAFELRNIQKTKQSEATDVYSLGYNFRNIGKFESIKELASLGLKMLTEDPASRYILIDCSVNLLKFDQIN